MWRFNEWYFQPNRRLCLQFFIAIVILLLLVIIAFVVFKKMSVKPEKIRDGELVGLGEFPHHVSISVSGIRTCGGSLISLKHVLTVANCVNGDVSTIAVTVGTITLPGGIVHEVDKVKPHSSYDKVIWQDNIAVVWLKNEVAETKHVRAAIIPQKPKEKIYNGRILVYTSFLRQDPSGPNSGQLRKFTVSVADCRENDHDLSKIFCAIVTPKYDSCHIDSGDPITVDKKYLIGFFLILLELALTGIPISLFTCQLI